MYYNYFRDYSPSSGRYVQSDPLGLGGGINTFSYVDENPLKYIDPKGLVKIHGNWCGPNWTGGKEHPYYDKPRSYYSPPISPMDSACRSHDICYSICREEHGCDKNKRGACMMECDRRLSDSVQFEFWGLGRGPTVVESISMYIWMKYNTFPDPGEDDENCPECVEGAK